jgi:hypothetical protein
MFRVECLTISAAASPLLDRSEMARPHFEKMLYDNALLTIANLEAYQLTGDELYKRVAERRSSGSAGR